MRMILRPCRRGDREGVLPVLVKRPDASRRLVSWQQEQKAVLVIPVVDRMCCASCEDPVHSDLQSGVEAFSLGTPDTPPI